MREFTARKQGGKAEIVIFDEIGQSFFSEGVTAKAVNEQLKSFGDVSEITVRINSPGGAVFDGLAIYNLLKQSSARIVVEIDGLAASAASVIAMAGDDIRMSANALMMIHPAQGVISGDADDLRERADVMDKITDNMVNIYAARTGLPREDLAALVSEDTWLSASEALDLNLITEITPDKAIAAKAVAHLIAMGDQRCSAVTSEATRLAQLQAKDTPVHTERKQQNTNQGTQMDIVKALGYDSEDQVLSAFGEIKTFQNGVVSALGATDPADAVQRITNMTAKVESLEAAVTAGKVQAEAVKVEAETERLTADMKLAPSQHGLYRSYSAEQREAFIATAAPVVATPQAPSELSGDTLVLTAAQEEIIVLCELNRDDFIAQVKIDQKAGV